MSILFIYYGVIVLLILIVLSGYAGWKVLLGAIFWPFIALFITLNLLFGWFFYDLEDRQ